MSGKAAQQVMDAKTKRAQKQARLEVQKQQEKEDKKTRQEAYRQRLKRERIRAADSDKALAEALDRLAETYSLSVDEKLIEANENRVRRAGSDLMAAQVEMEKAKAEQKRINADAAEETIQVRRQAATATADEAWRESEAAWWVLEKGYRKKNRDRKIKKKAIEMGVAKRPG